MITHFNYPPNRAFQSRLLRILSDMEKLTTFSGSRYDEPTYSEELEREYPNYRVRGGAVKAFLSSKI